MPRTPTIRVPSPPLQPPTCRPPNKFLDCLSLITFPNSDVLVYWIRHQLQSWQKHCDLTHHHADFVPYSCFCCDPTMAVNFASAATDTDRLYTMLTDVLCQHKLKKKKINHGPEQTERDLTQNMQDRQTQVRAGPARVVGRLRDTDGMVMDRRDATAAATDRWASLIHAKELSKAAEPWLSRTLMLFLTASLAFCLSSQSDPDCLSSVLTLALLPSVGGKFHKGSFGGWQWVRLPSPLRVQGEGGVLLIIHLFCPSSLSLSSHVSLPLHPTKSPHFYLIHSLIRPPPFATLSSSYISPPPPPPPALCISVEHILIFKWIRLIPVMNICWHFFWLRKTLH